jgi:chromosome segregation ATPase
MAGSDSETRAGDTKVGRSYADFGVEIIQIMGKLGPVTIIVAGLLFAFYMFYQALADAQLKADQQNQQKLDAAQKALVETYESISTLSQKQIANVQQMLDLHDELAKATEDRRTQLGKIQDKAEEDAKIIRAEAEAARAEARTARAEVAALTAAASALRAEADAARSEARTTLAQAEAAKREAEVLRAEAQNMNAAAVTAKAEAEAARALADAAKTEAKNARAESEAALAERNRTQAEVEAAQENADAAKTELMTLNEQMRVRRDRAQQTSSRRSATRSRRSWTSGGKLCKRGPTK